MMELIQVGKLGAQMGEVMTAPLGRELEKLVHARLAEKQNTPASVLPASR